MSPWKSHGTGASPGRDATERQRSGIGLIPYLLAPTEGPRRKVSEQFSAVFTYDDG
jgi:hypothetical protein